MKRALLIILTSLSTSLLYSQEADYILSNFLIARQGDKIYLRWTIRSGNTCEDTYIERATSHGDFKRIGIIGGICGSPNVPVTYSYTDTLPLPNQINSYRLNLGNIGYSSSKQLEFILLGNEGISIRPNPLVNNAVIYFENERKDLCEFRLSDMNGKTVKILSTHGNSLLLNREGLEAGVYFYIIRKNKHDSYRGKIIII